LLSSNRDDSGHKIKTSSVFFAARIAREPWYLCVFVLFLSKNENINGFDTIGLNSSLFDYKRVADIHFTVVFRIVFSGCLL
jgi:hypothetical protein